MPVTIEAAPRFPITMSLTPAKAERLLAVLDPGRDHALRLKIRRAVKNAQ